VNYLPALTFGISNNRIAYGLAGKGNQIFRRTFNAHAISDYIAHLGRHLWRLLRNINNVHLAYALLTAVPAHPANHVCRRAGMATGALPASAGACLKQDMLDRH